MPKNVAMISFGINSLKGGGGAERFFADLFDYYSQSDKKAFNLFWFVDKRSIDNMKEVNKLNSVSNLVVFKIFSNRFKTVLENFQVLRFIVFHRIKIIHVPQYNLYYLPILNFIQKLPGFIRPKISINIVDCSIPSVYFDEELLKEHNVRKTYEYLFKQMRVDGYIAWNKDFVDFVKKKELITHAPLLYSIKSRFCDTSKFMPEAPKLNIVVFASRLSVFKKPDWFVKAVLYLRDNHPELIVNWQFLLCGDGALKQQLIDFVRENDLSDKIEFVIQPQLQKVLNYSKCFVSCQDFDNFPSLSMAEAMASGNVIVSRNVGQTSLFVEDGKNGFLAKEDSEKGLALALLAFFQNQDKIDEMSDHSVHMMKEIHTVDNFITQIDEYWSSVLSTKNNRND